MQPTFVDCSWINVHAVDGGFTVADGGTWLPGVYDTPQTAARATKLPDERLRELSEQHDLITLEMLGIE